MENIKVTNKQLIYKKLAYEVQQIANPYLHQGGVSLSNIYLNHVVGKIPICMNTFRKMMKEDVSDFPQLAQDHKKKVQERYLERLNRQSRKRIKE